MYVACHHRTCNVYVFILQHENNTQNIMPEVQQGPEVLTAARNKKYLDQILATTYNITYNMTQ